MQALDALTLFHLAREATDLTQSAKVNKVQHLSPHEWALYLWGAKKGASRLYINLSAPVAAAWLTDDIRPFTQKQFTQPTGLSLLLRKHLLGARVIETLCDPGERVWTWVFRQINELGNTVTWHLVLELMGKHSNMMLVDPQTHLMTGLAHSVSEEMSTLRPLRPGARYTPPPRPDRPSLWQLTLPRLTQLFTDGPPYAPELREHTLGCSQYLFETMLPDRLTPTDAAAQALQLIDPVQLQPAMHTSGQAFSLRPDPPDDWHAMAETQHPVTTLIQHYYQPQCLQLRLQQHQHRLLQVLNARLTKHQRHLDQLERQSDTDVDAQVLADTLMAQLYQLPAQPGPQGSLTCLDLATGQPMQVHLPLPPESMPPQTTWMQTIQALYARARKQKTQAAMHAQRQALVMVQQQQAQTLRLWVQTATDLTTLDQLAQEIAPIPVKGKASPPTPPTYHQWQPDEQTTILVGKTQTANAQLLSKIARPRDWWFHARQMPGSHVLVKWQGEGALPDPVVAMAAGLAAWHSTGRDSNRVPVVYTQARHVRAIPDSYPGHVTYKQEAEVFVTPALPAPTGNSQVNITTG
jgi:predicted ribosome quality control (RQC) complex YloA/Tae2 family protein